MNYKIRSLSSNPGPTQVSDPQEKPELPHLADDTLMGESIEAVECALAPESRIVVQTEPNSLATDRFRLLRMSLNAHWMAGRLKTMLISSALPGEGKTTTALNLATSLAERGKRTVVLIEADFRQPVFFDRLGLTPWPGLVQALRERRDPFEAIRKIDPLGIYAMPAGQQAENPLDLLNSPEFTKMLVRLRSSVDWVILDCAPVLPVPDVQTLKSKVDGCLWVMRAGQTPRDLVEDAVQQVGQENIVCMVLNDAEALESTYSSYSRYGYGYGYGYGKNKTASKS